MTFPYPALPLSLISALAIASSLVVALRDKMVRKITSIRSLTVFAFTVSSKITGRVLEVNIEEGQRVAAGDLLARLDPVDAEAQRALVRSQLASSQSQLAEAESQLHLAELSLRRQQDLIDRKLTSQSALDAAQADRDSRAP